MFIQKEDLYSTANRTLIDAYEDQILDTVLEEQQRIIEVLLPNYDWTTIWAKKDRQRPAALLKYLKDILVYELMLRHAHDIPKVLQKRKEEAQQFFAYIQQGDLKPDWPLKNDPNASKWGSMEKYITRF